MESNLFRDVTLQDLLLGNQQKMVGEIESLRESDLDGRTDEEIADHFSRKFRAELPVIDRSAISSDGPVLSDAETRTRVRIRFPFSGNGVFFKTACPQSANLYREWSVTPQLLTIEYNIPRDDFPALENLFQGDLGKIVGTLESARDRVDRENGKLHGAAIAAIKARRAVFAKGKEFLAAFAKSGIRLVMRVDDVAELLTAPKMVELKYPKARPNPGEPAVPTLAIESYDQIVEVICDMSKVFERSPVAFAQMEEEHLRWVLLVGLNAAFKGSASGETFNRNGRTDILVKDEDVNVFLAECLMWQGAVYLQDKIDNQLLPYATWRDDKLALCIFNHKNKNFSEVIETMKAVLRKHPQFVRELPCGIDTGFRVEFHRKDDPARKIIITALAFDIRF